MATVPLSAFVRFAIMTGTAVFTNWDTISGLFDRHVENPTAPIFGYMSQHVFEMADTGLVFTPRERGLTTIHWINTTGGDLDTTWIAADYAAVESAVATMWTALSSYIGQDFRLVEHRWYAYGPGVVKPNPPSRVTTLGTPIVGGGALGAAHQMAETVTLRTPLRRHWGRFYLPISSKSLGVGGQFLTAGVDAIHSAARTMLLAPGTAQGIYPVVYDRARHVALGVTAIEADSVPDVIRRRRPRTVMYKKIATA